MAEEQRFGGYELINSLSPLDNIGSCLTATIMASQVLRALTLLASAAPNPLVNSVTEKCIKYLQSLGLDAMILVRNSTSGEFHYLSDIPLSAVESFLVASKPKSNTSTKKGISESEKEKFPRTKGQIRDIMKHKPSVQVLASEVMGFWRNLLGMKTGVGNFPMWDSLEIDVGDFGGESSDLLDSARSVIGDGFTVKMQQIVEWKDLAGMHGLATGAVKKLKVKWCWLDFLRFFIRWSFLAVGHEIDSRVDETYSKTDKQKRVAPHVGPLAPATGFLAPAGGPLPPDDAPLAPAGGPLSPDDAPLAPAGGPLAPAADLLAPPGGLLYPAARPLAPNLLAPAVPSKKGPALVVSVFEEGQIHLALALSVSEDIQYETMREEASQNVLAVALAESTEAERSFSDKSTYSPTPQRPKRVRPARLLPTDQGSPIFRKKKVSA